MALNINVPTPLLLKPKISIFGVGGAGGNAINNMIRSNLEGVEFIAANTDSQSLANSLATNRVQLGITTTKGLGAGSFPDRGKAAAEENIEEIIKLLDGNNMVFITAGMGGGTGTGAAPVIAKLARERDILTVGVVTKPFEFEGKYRMEAAERGIEELKKCVDTLIVIPNQNLFRIANEQTTFESAFKMADNVLHAGVRGVTDLITMPGLVNLDFADIRTIMTKSGKALMGTGEASGENRAIIACEEAISNPLLDDISIRGAKGVLVNMTGGPDMTLFEADIAVNAIKKEVDSNANIIFGSAFNEDMKGTIRISIVATGIDSDDIVNVQTVNQNITNLKSRSQMVYEVENITERKDEVLNIATQGKKTFFDPGTIKEPNQNISQIIDEEFFNINSSDSKQEIISRSDNMIDNKDFLDESQHNKQNFNPDKEDAFDYFGNHNNHISWQQPTSEVEIDSHSWDQKSFAKKNAKNNAKKKGIFNLFGLMNKDKDESEEEVGQYQIPIKPSIISTAPTNKNIIEDNNQNDLTKNKFIEDNLQFGNMSVCKNDIEEDGDLLNVPAFFRRKK
jgi:cell division protein FtsZ